MTTYGGIGKLAPTPATTKLMQMSEHSYVSPADRIHPSVNVKCRPITAPESRSGAFAVRERLSLGGGSPIIEHADFRLIGKANILPANVHVRKNTV